MAAFNKIILLGNLTRAPTFRTTSKETPVCNRASPRTTKSA